MPTYQGLSVCSTVPEHDPPDMINADLAHQVLQSLRTSLASLALEPQVSKALDKILFDFIGECRPCMVSLFHRMTSALPNPPGPPPPQLARMTSALSTQPGPPQPHLLALTVNFPPEDALPQPSWRALLAVQTPLPTAPPVRLQSAGTAFRPRRTKNMPVSAGALPSLKPRVMSPAIIVATLSATSPAIVAVQPPMWLLPLLPRTRRPATLTMAPARGPTPCS